MIQAALKRLRAPTEWLLGAAILAAAFGLAAADGPAATTPAIAPGFCAAPELEPRAAEGEAAPAWGELSIETVGRSTQTMRYVDCRELAEWRLGDRARFETYGAVTLYRGAALIAEAFPALGVPAPAQEGGAEDDAPIEAFAAAGALSGASAAPVPEPRSDPAIETVPARSRRRTPAPETGSLIQEIVRDGVLYRTELLEDGAALTDHPAAQRAGDAAASAEGLTMRMSGVVMSQKGGAAIERSLVMPYRGKDTMRYLQASLRAGLSADRLALLSLD